jgi:hypothetical protein
LHPIEKAIPAPVKEMLNNKTRSISQKIIVIEANLIDQNAFVSSQARGNTIYEFKTYRPDGD